MLNEPYFTNNIPQSGGQTRIVRGASQRIVRAVPGSQGKELREESVDYTPNYQNAEDWLSLDVANGIQDGSSTGYGKWEGVQDQISDRRKFPIEGAFDDSLSVVEERRVLDTANRRSNLMSAARVARDPVTRIPDNIAEQDMQSESDNFFGGEHPRQLDKTLDRIREVDPGRAQVDYPSGKAVPIKVLRRR